MKKPYTNTLILTLFLMLILGSAGCFRNEIQSFRIDLPEMVCESSYADIRQTLELTSGIVDFDLDLEGRVADIIFNRRIVAEKNIELAIARAGYSANSVRALPDHPQ